MAASPMSQQLLQHLHALSEVNEALTLRLLDLEERLRDLERRLEESQQDLGSDAAGLLAEADQRLLRLQDLLTAAPTQRTARPLARPSAPLASLRLGHDVARADDDEEGLEDQPFMDEMEACQDVA
jgi:TolA-binding protein